MRSFRMVIAAAVGVFAVLAGVPGPAFAAPSPSPSGRQPAIGVFDENGKQVKDPALIAKVRAGVGRANSGATSGGAISASGVDDYCPGWGGPYFDYTYNDVPIRLLRPCQWLNTGDSWTFGKSLMRFAPGTNGDLEIVANGTTWWDTGTGNSGATLMRFQTDANLVLYTASKRAVWSSNTYSWCGSSHAQGLYEPLIGLQSDSNFVIYCGGNWTAPWNGITYYVIQSIWATNTIG